MKEAINPKKDIMKILTAITNRSLISSIPRAGVAAIMMLFMWIQDHDGM
jgi:hypothetical protein